MLRRKQVRGVGEAYLEMLVVVVVLIVAPRYSDPHRFTAQLSDRNIRYYNAIRWPGELVASGPREPNPTRATGRRGLGISQAPGTSAIIVL